MTSVDTPARRIAFLDVDGTILDHHAGVSPKTARAIRTARENGHLVFLSTGRSAADIHPDVASIGFDGVISNGGALAMIDRETVVAHTMTPAQVSRITAYFTAHDIHFFLQTDRGVYADADALESLATLRRRWGGGGSESAVAPRFQDMSGIDSDRIAKAVFLSQDAQALTRTAADLSDEFHIVPGSIPLPGGSNGELGPKGVTKGAAITVVLDRLGLDASSAIGIGDSWNDVEMLQVCGVGIAMGNAPEELQALADDVTATIHEHGVAVAFERYGLIEAGTAVSETPRA